MSIKPHIIRILLWENFQHSILNRMLLYFITQKKEEFLSNFNGSF